MKVEAVRFNNREESFEIATGSQTYLFSYKLTIEAQRRVGASGLSKGDVVRRLGVPERKVRMCVR